MQTAKASEGLTDSQKSRRAQTSDGLFDIGLGSKLEQRASFIGATEGLQSGHVRAL